MKRRIMLGTMLGALPALAGCAGVQGFNSNLPARDIGVMPADAFGDTVVGEDLAIAAMNAATYAFAHPAAMQSQPAQMALAVASLEAMAGQFATNGRWSGMDNLAKLQMLKARAKVRAVLGVAADANCQDVIDGLVGAAQAIKRGDLAGARLALVGLEFTKGPDATLALLAHFPVVPETNVATMNASQFLYPMGGRSQFDGIM